jgi:son of sevenless-like protein
MTGTRPQAGRRSFLHLSIDPSPYGDDQKVSTSPGSTSPPSSPYVSVASSGTTPTSEGSDWVIYSVLCLYDFESHDPDHLPFTKNEILDIVKQEETGWWAAIRPGGKQIGWVPKAFVQPLTVEMTEKLRTVREELRVFEYEAEQLYNSAPISHLHHLFDPDPSPSSTLDGDWSTSESNKVRALSSPYVHPI